MNTDGREIPADLRRIGGPVGRLLVVDDEQELLAALRDMITVQGYEIAGFTDGNAALAALHETDFDVLLTDLMMPGLGGLELVQAAAVIDPHIVSIVMTGHATVQTAIEAMKAGVFDYILKPFKVRNLLPVLGRALAVRRLRLENLQLKQTIGIYELGQAISFSLELHTILDKVADGALQQCEADESSIMLPTADGGDLYIAAVRGKGREGLLGQRVPKEGHIAGWVVEKREPVMLQGAVLDSRFSPVLPRSEIALSVSLPLLAGGRLEGVLSLNFTRPRRPLNLGEIKALSILSSIAATALESARLFGELEAAELKYRDIFQNAPEGIFQMDAGGRRFLTANGALAGILGDETPEDLIARVTDIGKDVFQRPEDRAECIRHLEHEGNVSGTECEWRRRDGSAVWVSINARRVSDSGGGPDGIEGTVEEITRRKEAEMALSREKNLLRTVIDGLPDRIYFKDTGSRFRLANATILKDFGVQSMDGIVGKTDFDFLPRDLAGRFRGDEEQVIRTGTPLIDKEERSVDLEGKEKWHRTTTVPFRGEDGIVNGIVGIARDVTENRKLEEQLRQSQKMEAIGNLAGGVAHDFNNILTAIIGYSDYLLIRLGETNPLRREINEIKKAGGRAASLTQQLLAFSRKQIRKVEVLDLDAVVAGLEALLHRLLGEDVSFVTSRGCGSGRIRADEGQIEQVVLNLAINARDAMPDGGTLTIETADVDLDEGYVSSHFSVKPGSYAMLCVSDTGIGMDAETKSHLFEPFFTTKEPGKGTGLGLSTVYGIVKQNEGSIWVYSEPGRGTTFKVYFPRAGGSPAPAVHSRTPPGVATGTETILAIDDEEMIRDILCVLLKEGGYTVLPAKDGEEAERICAEHAGDIHLLLTDVVLPKINGREVARRLTARRPRMRVLFMSGYTANAISHHGVLDPDVAFIQKPFEPAALMRKVREVMDGGQP